MRDLLDLLTDLAERIRHTTATYWFMLAVIIVGALIAVGSLVAVDGFSPVIGVVTVASLIGTLLRPRGFVPTVFMISCSVWAMIGTTADDLLALVGVALGLLLVGWGCFLTSLGPSYAVVGAAVRRPVLTPLVAGLVLLVPVTGLVVVLRTVHLPAISAGLVVLLLLLVAGLAVTLWPDLRTRRH
ncbi:hypothetical protein ACOKSZ_07005 [Propionibacteriaceae bacterium Y1685]